MAGSVCGAPPLCLPLVDPGLLCGRERLEERMRVCICVCFLYVCACAHESVIERVCACVREKD